MLEPYLAVGEIVKPQGIRGELKIRPLTDDPERFFALRSVRILDQQRALRCQRANDGFVYARIEGVYTREAAEVLRGVLIYIRRDQAVELPEDTEFICDLIGCAATDTEGLSHGILTDVLQNGGAVDVYVFKGEKGTLMAPALKKTVLSVDVAGKRMLLDANSLHETAVYDES